MCGKEYDTRYAWKANITYGAHGYASLSVCPDCIERHFNTIRIRLRFFEELVHFRRSFKKSLFEKWDILEIKAFLQILERENIPVKNYGIPLYYRYDNQTYKHYPIYLHDLVEKLRSNEQESPPDG